MAEPGMTPAEREDFVAGVRVGVLAVAHSGHGPVALPVWYIYRDGEFQVLTQRDSLKGRLLAKAGRATMTVQDEAPPYRYVSAEGPVVLDPAPDIDLEMASRYLGPEMGAWYARNNASTDKTCLVRLKPERWRTVDYGKVMGRQSS
jgi:hypothetical protein